MEYLQNLWNALDLSLLGDLLMRVAAVLLCLVVHETCHGLAAYAMGDPTAKRMHRLSLNPLHHIDWFGLAAMLVAGFGWAKPVPVNMRRFRHPKSGMALTALAGPFGNFLIALLLTPCYAAAVVWYQVTALQAVYYLAIFLMMTITVSIGLMVFNLIPIPPLDGSKILFSVLPSKWYKKLMKYERYGSIVLVLLLYFGILDTPLSFLRNEIQQFIFTVAGDPVVRLLIG